MQGTVVADSFLAFTGFALTDGFGGSFSGNHSRPAVIGAVEFRGGRFAGAIGFAAGALGGGDTARQEWQADWKSDLFCLHLDVIIH